MEYSDPAARYRLGRSPPVASPQRPRVVNRCSPDISDTLAVSEAKRQLGALVDRAHLGRQPVHLSGRGKRVVAIVDADELDRLLATAEDVDDRVAADLARRDMHDTGATPTS